MEIKCKISFNLPKALMEALDINDDTPLVAFISNGQITVELTDDDGDAYTENDLYNEDEEDECGSECDCCEYFCPHCGKCILN